MFILMMLLTACTVHAADLPGWVDRPPRPDRQYRYYVGRAAEEASEPRAYKDATRDAMESAIRENFGVTTSIDETDFESTGYSALDKRMNESSSQVKLEEFEQIDSHLTRSEKEVSVYLLFRYSAAAIAKEKARLASGAEITSQPLSEAGEIGLGTALKVESHPAGAEVFIDDERWGITPVAIRGALKAGSHQLIIRHPSFDDVSELIVLPAKGEKTVSKILRPATVTLTIDTLPNHAQITVDGVRKGSSPIEVKHVPVGTRVVVQAFFDKRNSLSRTLELKKGEDQSVRLDLPEAAPTPEPQASPQPQVYQTVTAADLAPSYQEEPYQSASIVGLGLEYSGANIPQPYGQSVMTFGVSYEKRFFYRLGIRLKGGLDVGGGDSQSSQSNQSSSSSANPLAGVSYGIGLPIYLSGSANSVYLMPEFGGISYDVTSTTSNSGSSTTSNSSASSTKDISLVYPRIGLTIGYQDPSSHFNLFVSYYDYNWGVLGHHATAAVGIAYLFER